MANTRQLAALVDAHRRPGGSTSLSFHAWVSLKHRYVYIATPKVACTKIKLALHELEGLPIPDNPNDVHFRELPGCTFVPSLIDFSTAEAVEILTSPEWFRFCFVRNPYYRLFSAYKSKILNYMDEQYQGVQEEIRKRHAYPIRHGAPAGMVAFRDFVRYVQEMPDERRDDHWRTQTGLLMPDAIPYDAIGHLENFVHDFGDILRRFGAPAEMLATIAGPVNPTMKTYHAAAYDRELASCVFDTYKADFDNFGYDPDSWSFDY